MKKLEFMKSNQETGKHKCDFCGREFVRETTIEKHVCENKRRYQDKDKQANRIGFQTWLQFYNKNSNGKKKRTYDDFVKSAYYIAFVKFGNYCATVNVLNVNRYADWLLKNNISIDTWAQDSNYTKFIIDYLKTEDPLDAIARSIETTVLLAEEFKVQTKDVFRYGNKNKICYQIVKGKISPWILYQSTSGIQFIESLDVTQQKMILDYINPEQWAIKFKRQSNIISEIKELLNAGGY
jgi:hypothetical protein